MSGEVSSELLGTLVHKIVELVHPRQIILFGSAARGQMGPHSDLDILVVMPDGAPRRQTAQKIYRGLYGSGIAKDIVVVTESDLQQYGNNPSLVIYSALREGIPLYVASQ